MLGAFIIPKIPFYRPTFYITFCFFKNEFNLKEKITVKLEIPETESLIHHNFLKLRWRMLSIHGMNTLNGSISCFVYKLFSIKNDPLFISCMIKV